MIALSSPRPRLRTSLLAAAALLGAAVLVAPTSCGDDRPTGFHTINVAWGDAELGLVWLDRQGGSEHVRFARSSVNPLRLKGEPVVATTKARSSEPPILAWGAGRYLLAWTHDGPEPGLFVRSVRGGVPEGTPLKVTKEKVQLCRQMVFTGEMFALAWATEEGIHLGTLAAASLPRSLVQPGVRVQLGGEEPSAGAPTASAFGAAAWKTTTVASWSAQDADAVGECKIAWDGETFRLLWSQHTGEVRAARIRPTGDLVASSSVGKDSRRLALATAGETSLVVTTSATEPGATLHRLGGKLESEGEVQWPVAGIPMGIDLARGASPFVIWSASKREGGTTGKVDYAFVKEDGTLSPPQNLTRFGGHPTVNAVTNAEGRVAVSWSDTRSSGTVRWALVNQRTGATSSAAGLEAVAGVAAGERD